MDIFHHNSQKKPTLVLLTWQQLEALFAQADYTYISGKRKLTAYTLFSLCKPLDRVQLCSNKVGGPLTAHICAQQLSERYIWGYTCFVGVIWWTLKTTAG